MTMKKSALLYLIAYIIVLVFDGVQQLIPDKELSFLAPLVLYPIFCFLGIYLFQKELQTEWCQLLERKWKSVGVVVGGYIINQVLTIMFVLLSMGLMTVLHLKTPLQNDSNIERVMTLVPAYITLPVLGILGPIVEELIFRKILQESFNKHLSTWLTITLQAILFAAIHVNKLELAEFIQVLPHFGSGLLFGLIKEKTGNTWCVIVPHVLNNVFGLLHYL